MAKLTCPQCGAALNRNGSCSYCGNDTNGHDYTQELKATFKKQEIRELQLEIKKEQAEIDNLLKTQSPNGCLQIGMGIIIVAIVIVTVLVTIFRGGDGIVYVGIGAIIVLPFVYAICKWCDNSGNEDTQKEIKAHQRTISKLTKEIEEIKNGIS